MDKKDIYDDVVVGAGIAGCCGAFSLKQKGRRVLLVDRSGVPASGGSGAAGAFVSPKIGKGSTLQELTNEAYEYAKDFYTQNFPRHFYQTGIIRIPKDEDDAKKFGVYEEFNHSKYRWVDRDELHSKGITQEFDSFLFEEAGVCDAPAMCREIFESVEFRQFGVDRVSFDGECWSIIGSDNSKIYAHNVILSTGYENELFDMRYMGVRGTWGSRGDYYSNLDFKVSIHKKISISANIDGIIKLGATHNKSKNPCRVCDGYPLKMLEDEAKSMIDSSDLVLKETFCGMRAGSKDYFPLVGRVIDSEYMLREYPKITRGLKVEPVYLNNIYILNGLGGRGFVFAPLMSKWLSELIVDAKEIDERVSPDRLFLKWCRKAFR